MVFQFKLYNITNGKSNDLFLQIMRLEFSCFTVFEVFGFNVDDYYLTSELP